MPMGRFGFALRAVMNGASRKPRQTGRVPQARLSLPTISYEMPMAMC